MFQSHKLLCQFYMKNFKWLSTISKSKYVNNSKVSPKYIKAGFINFVRLDSGEEVCIIRPPNLHSVIIKPDELENMCKDKEHYTESQNIGNVSIHDNDNLSQDLINGSIEPDSLSVSEFLSYNVTNLTLKQRLEMYGKLGKLRLTTLVVISAISGCLVAPVPFDLNTILLASVGTFCTSMSANSINQILEVPYDSQMKRTKNRPLVLGKITPLHASIFAIVFASCGSGLLYSCCPLACGLGLTNLVLYTAIYTPLKRKSILNTWIGSIVGAIPPLIGWAAVTGGIHPGGLLLSSMLFCWQFPHFMALSWNLKSDYSKAGYQMASIVSPDICKISALRHSILISALCPVAPMISLTDWCFLVEILPFNLALCLLAYRFYSNPTSSNSRKLFRYTLFYLPILMTLLILNKSQYDNNNVNRINKDVS